MAYGCGQDDLKKNRSKGFVFHPFEVFICGYKNSGKTTLIKKIVAQLSKEMSVGYIKHDTHQFDMDQNGKDTDEVYKSGADGIFIQDASEKFAFLGKALSSYESPVLLNEFDVVIIEGYKSSKGPKILILDDDGQALKELNEGKITNVLAVCGEVRPNTSLPFFNRNETDEILSFVKKHFISLTPPLYGLVLAGGASTRMGKDKSQLIYHDDKPQYAFLSDLISPFCDQVFLSARRDQKFNFEKIIFDQYLGYGPMGGLLSAFHEFPGAAWLVLACDLPFVNSKTINRLISNRNPFRNATAYISYVDGFPEPLCAIYEPKSIVRMHQFASLGYRCPRKVLINSKIHSLVQEKNDLENANTQLEFESAKQIIVEKNSD